MQTNYGGKRKGAGRKPANSKALKLTLPTDIYNAVQARGGQDWIKSLIQTILKPNS